MTTDISKWRKLSGRPITVEGHEFAPYSIGVMRSVWYCPTLDATLWTASNYKTHSITIGGNAIKSPRTGKTHRFLTRSAAFRAAIKTKVTT